MSQITAVWTLDKKKKKQKNQKTLYAMINDKNHMNCSSIPYITRHAFRRPYISNTSAPTNTFMHYFYPRNKSYTAHD